VKGGLYGEYPNLAPNAQLDGDVRFNTDYRDVYATILESFLELDSEPILNSRFGQLDLAAV
jgi:uncharacterized protein (DUF1501 family)